jgi:ATP-dependent phosphoenolpyruvate carboxykinase
LQVPKQVSRVPDEILQPSSQWKDGAAFDKSLRHLASLYSANFKK